jgi:drug/metabolite transporter (DMT)-like permease
MWKLALVPALINTAGQVLWAMAPYFLDAGLIGFIIRLSTIWGVLGSVILFTDERSLLSSPFFWSGIVFALSGFTLLIGAREIPYTRANWIGILIVVLCSIFVAGYHLSIRRFLSHINSPAAFGMVACMTSVGLSGLMFTAGEPSRALEMPSTSFGLVLLSGFLGIAVSHVLLYYSISKIGVAIPSIFILSSAFLTALFARLIFGEHMNGVQWMGGLILFLGGACSVISQKDLKTKKTQDDL